MVNGSEGPAIICAAVVVEITRLDMQPGETLLLKLRGDHLPEIMDRLGQYARQAVPEGCKIMVIDDHVEVSKISVS